MVVDQPTSERYVDQIYDWVSMETDIELAAVLLTRAAAHEQATTLYGHLATRAASLVELRIHDHAAEPRSAGAAMTLREMAAYTLVARDTTIRQTRVVRSQ